MPTCRNFDVEILTRWHRNFDRLASKSTRFGVEIDVNSASKSTHFGVEIDVGNRRDRSKTPFLEVEIDDYASKFRQVVWWVEIDVYSSKFRLPGGVSKSTPPQPFSLDRKVDTFNDRCRHQKWGPGEPGPNWRNRHLSVFPGTWGVLANLGAPPGGKLADLLGQERSWSAGLVPTPMQAWTFAPHRLWMALALVLETFWHLGTLETLVEESRVALEVLKWVLYLWVKELNWRGFSFSFQSAEADFPTFGDQE